MQEHTVLTDQSERELGCGLGQHLSRSMEGIYMCGRRIGILTTKSIQLYRSASLRRCLRKAPNSFKQTSVLTSNISLQTRCISQSNLLKGASQTESLSDDELDGEEVSDDMLGAIDEKPAGYMAAKPIDDVYMIQHYPPQLVTFDEAMDKLRSQDKWAYCRNPEKYRDRTVTISVVLDMVLEKKKKVVPFQNMVILPHPFKEENKVLCFVDETDVRTAKDAGAHIIGGEEIVDDVLTKRIKDFDYCVATPEMMRSLTKLKERLRKRYPNSKRGSVSNNIPAMLNLYRKGQEYKVQAKCGHINVAVGKLSLSNEHIEENIATILTDVCKHKPVHYGSFIKKLVLNAFLLDGHQIQFDKYLPEPDEDKDLKEELERLEQMK